MNRLTERSENGKAVYRHPTPEPEGWEANRGAVLERCCRYEETGLTPEEIMDGKLPTGWISVEERLPEKPKENPVFENKPLELYFVTTIGGDNTDRVFWNGKSFTDGWTKLNVLAWMPMPEPYRPGEPEERESMIDLKEDRTWHM